MKCELCLNSKKDWNDDDRICGFTNDKFSSNNWNCETLNQLRDKLEEHQISYNKYSENKLATIPYENGFVIIGWYKSRGKVDFLSLINNNFLESNSEPTLKEIENILKNL